MKLRKQLPPEPPEKFNFKKATAKLRKSRKEAVNVEWRVSSPPNSMAYDDLKRGWISSSDKVQTALVPLPIARMLAEENRNSLQQSQVKSDANRTPLGPICLKPLMSLHLRPPLPTNFFNQPPSQNVGNKQSADEKRIFDILKRVNTMMTTVATVLGTTVRACVERRSSDHKICLYTYFQHFPWAVIGGVVILSDEPEDTPPPPAKIFDVWRNQFFESLRTFVPPPIFSRMKRHVDQDINMAWNVKFLESSDFRKISTKIFNFRNNTMYTKLWSTPPMDCDPRDSELAAVRAAVMKQVEMEMKSFWTYERIGVHLKMI